MHVAFSKYNCMSSLKQASLAQTIVVFEKKKHLNNIKVFIEILLHKIIFEFNIVIIL